MTDPVLEPYGDPITAPFWEAAARHNLVIQQCEDCTACQFYPRPICLACESRNLAWIGVSGDATIYALTTVHLRTAPEFEPPYVTALVDLDEGVRMLTNIIGDKPKIGDRVRLAWRERDGLPPLPIWTTE